VAFVTTEDLLMLLLNTSYDGTQNISEMGEEVKEAALAHLFMP